MNKRTKYVCQYCGTDGVCDTLPQRELALKRCSKCNHGKFDLKPLKTGDVNYYEGENITLTPSE